ncbi:MAG TPA: glycosyltransferase family 4 protein [Verrucomicrobiae bacterium]|jgi:glycosyltransferase involved in cell wall biosynthesis|nr:glycosyltransferase family 4 protein [Verrucomicrobiae bacterium]
MKITLTTGGAPHYETGLIQGLVNQNIALDVIGGDELEPALAGNARVNFRNFQGGSDPRISKLRKLLKVAGVYWKMIRYAATTDSKLFHIQWPYKLVLFDRTLLLLYYKLLGKKIIFTAHNVDADARDGTSTWLRHASLRFFYRNVNHLIVHTGKMKEQLVKIFGVPESRISVIPHGVMTCVPDTNLTREAARTKLELPQDEPVILFFGLITPYKGIETLVEACGALAKKGKTFKLVIVGRVKECRDYWEKIEGLIEQCSLKKNVRTDLRHVPDEDVEIYLKAADVMVLPYREIFQSGALFLTYRFGLPVAVTDVGSLREDVEAANAGVVCQTNDAAGLTQALEEYLASDFMRDPESHRARIREYAAERYSWERIGKLTEKVYQQVLQN